MPRIYLFVFINKEENIMNNQMHEESEIKLPTGVRRNNNVVLNSFMPHRIRSFVYRSFKFNVVTNIGAWYQIHLVIPKKVFDELFYDKELNLPNKQFMDIVNWRYSSLPADICFELKHTWWDYDDNLEPLYQEIWLRFDGLNDRPMSWDEYKTEFKYFISKNPELNKQFEAVKQRLNSQAVALEEYCKTFIPYEPRVNVWNIQSLINEAVCIIDNIIGYAKLNGIDLATGEYGPITSFRGEYDFLSNFYPCEICLGEPGAIHVFQNAEAAFQSFKCDDPDDIEQFVNMNGKQAKCMGRKVKLRSDWESIKDNVMKCVVSAKFTQNRDLRNKLLATGNRELIEGNTWDDTYWGVCKGKGQNKLGEILMDVREELKYFTPYI